MKERILFLDYARVITAFLVVFGHLYPASSEVRLYLYAFHMPLFFLISGFLHSQRTSNDEVKKYLRTLLVPILFFIIIGAIVKSLVNEQNIVILLYRTLKGCILHGKVHANYVVWFLFALLGTKLLMFEYLKLKEERRKLYLIVGCLFLFGIIVLCYITKINLFFLKHTFMAFPFYFLGFCSRKYYDNHSYIVLSNIHIIVGVLIFAVLCFLLTTVNGRVSMFSTSFGHAVFPFNVLLFYINGVIGSIMILLISFLFKTENKIISLTAGSLITILGFQEPLLDIIRYKEDEHIFLLTIFVSIFITIVCVILHQAIMSYCPELLGKNRSVRAN